MRTSLSILAPFPLIVNTSFAPMDSCPTRQTTPPVYKSDNKITIPQGPKAYVFKNWTDIRIGFT
jgi:hypothetical protein